ncbi:hypothetical protein [Providencia huaxiensis]|uniref:hypothetical protein n=1 Tax=Providencia huaxiensis TaxID=2027290 RepID=UPI0034DD7A58
MKVKSLSSNSLMQISYLYFESGFTKRVGCSPNKIEKTAKRIRFAQSVTGDNALKSQIMDLRNRRITQLQVENDALKAKGRTSSTAGLAGRVLPSIKVAG